MSDKSGLRLVGGIFAFTGAALLAAAAWTGNQQVKILKTWPEVPATVVNSQVTHYISHDSDRNRNRDTTMFKTEVEFRYRVDGRDYTTPSQSDYSSSSYTEMKRKADAFPPGSVHTIKYNPADPNDIRHTAGYTFGFFFLPVLFGGMGVVFGGLGVVFLKISGRAKVLLCPACRREVEKSQKFCPQCATPLGLLE